MVALHNITEFTDWLAMARQIRRFKSTSNIYLRALDVVAGPLTLTDLALSRQRSLTAGHFELDQSKNYKS